MTIKKSRISPTTVKIWDDEFDPSSLYLLIDRDLFGDGWSVMVVSDRTGSSQLGFPYRSAKEAVEKAVNYLKNEGAELDEASSSIENGQ